VKVHVEPNDIQEVKADSRGRITLGSEYAAKNIEVAILEVKDD